jgi:hypothetical protein
MRPRRHRDDLASPEKQTPEAQSEAEKPAAAPSRAPVPAGKEWRSQKSSSAAPIMHGYHGKVF